MITEETQAQGAEKLKKDRRKQIRAIRKASRIDVVTEFAGKRVPVEITRAGAENLIKRNGRNITVGVYHFTDGSTEIELDERRFRYKAVERIKNDRE